MNKPEIIQAMVEKTGLTKKDTELALSAFQEVVTETLISGEKVQLTGFGTFDITNRAERMGRNPQTGQEIKILASKTPKFKAGKGLKDAVNAR